MKPSPKQIQILKSYLRSIIVAVLVLVQGGETDAKKLASAAVLAAVGPILAWLDPTDARFGRGS